MIIYNITTKKQKGVVTVKNGIVIDVPNIWRMFKSKRIDLLFRWIRSTDKDFKIYEK